MAAHFTISNRNNEPIYKVTELPPEKIEKSNNECDLRNYLDMNCENTMDEIDPTKLEDLSIDHYPLYKNIMAEYIEQEAGIFPEGLVEEIREQNEKLDKRLEEMNLHRLGINLKSK